MVKSNIKLRIITIIFLFILQCVMMIYNCSSSECPNRKYPTNIYKPNVLNIDEFDSKIKFNDTIIKDINIKNTFDFDISWNNKKAIFVGNKNNISIYDIDLTNTNNCKLFKEFTIEQFIKDIIPHKITALDISDNGKMIALGFSFTNNTNDKELSHQIIIIDIEKDLLVAQSKNLRNILEKIQFFNNDENLISLNISSSIDQFLVKDLSLIQNIDKSAQYRIKDFSLSANKKTLLSTHTDALVSIFHQNDDQTFVNKGYSEIINYL